MSEDRIQLELPLNNVLLPAVEPLSTREESLLIELEGHIEEHLKGFKIVGHALSIIKEEKLYRLEYDTFEEYCAVQWDLSRPRAYQLTDCYMVLNHLSTMVDNNDEPKFKTLPVNERQTRPLTCLNMEQQAEAWAMVVEESKEKDVKITGAFVQRWVDILIEKKIRNTITPKKSQTQGAALPPAVQLSFESFLTELKGNSELALNPGGKKELAKMLREILEAIEV